MDTASRSTRTESSMEESVDYVIVMSLDRSNSSSKVRPETYVKSRFLFLR